MNVVTSIATKSANVGASRSSTTVHGRLWMSRRRPPASLRRSPSTVLETHDSCDGDDWRPVVAGSPSKTLPARGTTLKGKLLRSGYGSTDVVYNNQCLKGKVYYVVDRQRLPLNGWSTTSLLSKATTSKGTLLRRFQERNVVECMALTSCLGEERRGMHGYYTISRRRPPLTAWEKLRCCCRKQRRRLSFFSILNF